MLFLPLTFVPYLGALAAPVADPGSEEASEEVVVVRGREGPTAGAATVTVVPVDDRLPATADLPSVVSMAPGTQVRRLGGLGSYATLSLRGSSERQVEVLLDGVPLNPDGASALNLADLPLAAFSRVEVYRGLAPLDLGAAPIGGVVHLVTREEPASGVGVTAGSFRSGRLSGLWRGDPARGPDLLIAGEALSAGGGWRFHDDRGTVYVPDDDLVRARENADRHQGAIVARWRTGGPRARFTWLHSLLAREEGVPGFAFAPTREVRYETLGDLQAWRLDAVAGATRVGVLAWAGIRRERLRDAQGEVGLGPRHTDELTLSPGLRATLGTVPSRRIALHALFDLHGDRYVARELLAGAREAPRARLVARGGAGATVVLGPLELHPSLLATALRSGEARIGSVDPRLGARLDLTDRLALTANAARALRPPDPAELWGDRGATVGNPDLRPERGTTLDLGARWEGERLRAELVGFASRARDRIVWVQNAQRVARPENLGDSWVIGVEASVTLAAGPLESWTSLTRTASAQISDRPAYDGKALPRLPAWSVAQRTAFVGEGWRVGHTLTHASSTWYDAVNWYRAAPRTLHGIFVRLGSDGLELEAEVSNLTDRIAERVPANPLDPEGASTVQPVTDFAGMPLPGRTLYLTLRWTP